VARTQNADNSASGAAPRRGRRRAPTATVRRNEDTSHAALMAALADETESRTLFSKASFIARARYGLRVEDAEDVFHEAVATYLVVHSRYGPADNHFGLLVGIFHKKALEHLGARDRTGRVARRFVARLRSDRPGIARGEDPQGAAVERVIREEDAELIRAAIESLNDEGRQMLLSLAEGRLSRLEMIAELGVNRNTFDTRLRALRQRLRERLSRSGVV
jgi:RNA polymerase sigma factor (sigma-70 family)